MPYIMIKARSPSLFMGSGCRMKPQFYILSIGIFSALISYAWRMNRNRTQINQERQKADLLRKDLQLLKAEQKVNETIIKTLLQNRIDKVQQISSTFFYWSDEAVMLREALEGKAMKEEVIAAFRQDLRRLRDDVYFVSNIEKALNQAQGQLMRRFRSTVYQTPDLHLDEMDYALLTLFFANFPTKSICFLMDMKDDAVRKRKSRYKHLFLERGDSFSEFVDYLDR